MGNRLYTVKQILEAGIYETVDLKVKVITKSQSKQSVVSIQSQFELVIMPWGLINDMQIFI